MTFPFPIVPAARQPIALSGLAQWLRADRGIYTDTGGTTPVTADAQTVGLWKDQSGNGRDMTQSTSGFRPAYKAAIVNGMPVLRFDGTDDYLTGANLSSLAASEVFLVVKAVNDPGVGSPGLWANPSSNSTTASCRLRISSSLLTAPQKRQPHKPSFRSEPLNLV